MPPARQEVVRKCLKSKPSEFADWTWTPAEINMLSHRLPFPYPGLADLASDRVLYPRDRPRNVITGRNPQRAEYQTGPTAH